MSLHVPLLRLMALMLFSNENPVYVEHYPHYLNYPINPIIYLMHQRKQASLHCLF